MIEAYSRIFADPRHPRLKEAAIAWSVWEGMTSYLSPSGDMASYADPAFAIVFARIENHYFINGAFLGGRDRNNNYLIENAAVIAKANIPVYIVQGQFDQVCPRFQADELIAALKAANPEVRLKYVVTCAGHSQFERETALALVGIMDEISW